MSDAKSQSAVEEVADLLDSFEWLTAPSGCAGGEGGGNALCRPGLGGIYCMGCSDELAAAGGHYYNSAKRECLECTDATLPLAGAAAVLLLLLVGSCVSYGRLSEDATAGARQGWLLAALAISMASGLVISARWLSAGDREAAHQLLPGHL